MIKTYYYLTKPGIIRGNALTAAAGFLLAAGIYARLTLFFATLAGLSLIVASACVFNNYLDRHIDAAMARTKRRALVRGLVSGRNALIYATVLGLAGAALLAVFTNLLTLAVALFGLFAYVVLYGIAKRRTVYGTVVGSISGAVPPVVGYTAVTGRLDGGALILFLIVVLWQMPHFYAIAMYRQDDYAAAKIPVWPIVKGARSTKIQISLYITAFIAAAASLAIFGYAGYTYLAVTAILGLVWLGLSLRGFRPGTDDKRWARGMFLYSLLVIAALCAMIAVNAVLP